jgi:hypothetical protein
VRKHGQAPNIDSVLHGWQSCPVHVVESDVSISDDERSEGSFYNTPIRSVVSRCEILDRQRAASGGELGIAFLLWRRSDDVHPSCVRRTPGDDRG